MDSNTNYPSHQSGPTTGQSVRHPVESARAGYDAQTGSNTGVYSAGQDTGSVGTTAGNTSNVDDYGQNASSGPGATSGSYGAGAAVTGVGTGHHGHHHHGHHAHGEHVYTGTDSAIPGNVFGTGEGRLPGSGGAGNVGQDTLTTGRGAGVGAGGYDDQSSYGTGTRTGAGTGTEHSHGTGTGVGAGATSDAGHKPSMSERLRGNVEVLAGKVTSDQQRVLEGEQLKEGIHPSQTGGSGTY
jgi:hypothetical protein